MTRCVNYRSRYGCDIDCPVLLEGKCDYIGDVLDGVVMDDEEETTLREIYKEELE
jgi:hypothetical protein